MPPDRLVTHLRAMDPHRLDAVLALLVLAETQVEASFVGGSASTRLEAHLLGVAAALCVALHRRRALTAFFGAQVLFVVAQASGRLITDALVLPLFVVLFMNTSAAAQVSDRRFWIVPVTAAAGAVLGLAVGSDPGDLTGYLFTVSFFAGVPAAGGRLLDSRRRLSVALREKARRAAAEEAERAELAAVAERERIAGELHDIISHALSGMVIQAAGARRLSDTSPADAKDAFAAVEASGRDALGELRRLLGVLRREDEELVLAPSPSLSHVDVLARRVASAGLPVRLHVEGDAVALPAGVDVAAYRVVQEALGAALEAGGAGRADVVVRYRADGVELEVRDDGTKDADDPRRLVGMRERVALVGGELVVGRPRDGGYAVRARLPVGEGAA